MAVLDEVFSASGRTPVARFVVVTSIALAIFYLATLVFDRGGPFAYVATGAILGAVLAKLFTEGCRRLHDMDHSASLGLLSVMLATGLLIALTVTDLSYDPPWAFPLGTGVMALVLGAVFLRPGSPGPNRHGPPPPDGWRSSVPVPVRDGRRSTACAGLSIVGCALASYGVIATSQAIRSRHEANARFAQEHRPPAAGTADQEGF